MFAPIVTSVVAGPSILESNPPVAGERYVLFCAVNGNTNDVSWIGPDGMAVVPDGRITVVVVPGSVTSSALTFSSLSLEDSGQYRCGTPLGNATMTVHVGSKYLYSLSANCSFHCTWRSLEEIQMI